MHIRIIPNDQSEFPSQSDLQSWLLTTLKASGGIYRLRSEDAIAELPAGSVALFRYGHYIVGEAIAREHVREEHTERMLSGETIKYPSYIRFAPDSIRLYAPPLSIEKLQEFIGGTPLIGVARGHKIIPDWSVYPKILAHVTERGRLIPA